MKVLADTSIWVDYLRRGRQGKSALLDDLLANSEVLLCGPVVAELLVGAKVPDRSQLWHLFAGLPWAELGRNQWRRVGEIAAGLRERGEVVALTDVEIAVAAADADAELWTRDQDFLRVSGVLHELHLFEP